MKRIKKSLIFSILWVTFFCLFGLLYKIIKDKFFAWDTLSNFFSTDYSNWFSYFYNGTNYLPANEVLNALLSQWYYFFISGGILAIIINLLLLLFFSVFKKKTPTQEPSKLPETLRKPEPLKTPEQPKEIPQEDPRLSELKLLLEKAHQYLLEGDVMASRAVYKSLQQKYSSSIDKDKAIYNQSIRLYQEILKHLNK